MIHIENKDWNSLFRKLRYNDRILHGNWEDDTFFPNEQFDIVIADYLLGAIDGFAPYFQDQLFGRLKKHMKDRLYIVGLEPYPDVAKTEGGMLILELARLRDACILLAQHRCYREYPITWVIKIFNNMNSVFEYKNISPIHYTRHFIDGQIKVCKGKTQFLASSLLREGIQKRLYNWNTGYINTSKNIKLSPLVLTILLRLNMSVNIGVLVYF